MLWRMVVKLMLKAMLPLGIVAGIVFYVDYTRGGNPAALLGKVVAGIGSQISSSFSTAQSSASAAAARVSDSTNTVSGDLGQATDQLYTWQDAEGLTHYSSSAPLGIESNTITINPNTNVLAPIQIRTLENTENNASPTGGRASSQTAARTDSRRIDRPGSSAVSDLEAEMGERLPGIAGHLLSGQSRGELPAGIDPAQLIHLLQTGGVDLKQ